MSQFNLQVPINPTSLGQVSTNMLYEFFLKKLEPNIFLIGNPDISSFDGLLPEDFTKWLNHCCGKAQSDFKSSDPTLKLWHINGSFESVGKNRSVMRLTNSHNDGWCTILINQTNLDSPQRCQLRAQRSRVRPPCLVS